MATPKEVVWEQDPHTAEKLKILRYYLDAWWTIILSRFPAATYVDAFSGPGVYKGGEDGSPVVALRALLEHSDKDWWGKPARAVFADADRRRVTRLRHVLDDRFPALPSMIETYVQPGQCGQELLQALHTTGCWGDPVFAFLDPYGVDVPFDVVQRIARNPNSEVLVTFMSSWLTRFAKLEELPQGDQLFGDDRWRRVTEQPSEGKRRWLVDAYRARLKDAGFTYRLAFELIDEGGRGFFLVHGTSNELGLQKMKEAMWKVDPVRGIRFRDPRDTRQISFDIGADDPDLRGLEDLLAEKLAKDGPTTVEELRRWALLDTVFLEKHVPAVLRKWRDRFNGNPLIDIQPPGGQVDRTKIVRLLRRPPQQHATDQQVLGFPPAD